MFGGLKNEHRDRFSGSSGHCFGVTGLGVVAMQDIINIDTAPDSIHLNVKQVATILGVSVTTVWEMVKRKTLPQPRKFSARCTRWDLGGIRKAVGVQRKEA
jgi:predicted DNA-binding transcriptional regulator AlpA